MPKATSKFSKVRHYRDRVIRAGGTVIVATAVMLIVASMAANAGSEESVAPELEESQGMTYVPDDYSEVGDGDVSEAVEARGGPLQQTGGLIHYPSDTPEPVIVRREEAWELARSDPDLADPSIIPTLISYIQDADAEVKWAGEASINLIAASEEAENSGLRAAVRADGTLTNTLFANVDFESLDALDREVRAEAVNAIRHLYFETPSPAIEQLAVDRFWKEASDQTLLAILYLLCEHQYSSQGTVDVLTEFSQWNEPPFSPLAAECLAAIP